MTDRTETTARRIEMLELPAIQFEFDRKTGLVVSGDARTTQLSRSETWEFIGWFKQLVKDLDL